MNLADGSTVFRLENGNRSGLLSPSVIQIGRWRVNLTRDGLSGSTMGRV
jgi:hypothetical protein